MAEESDDTFRFERGAVGEGADTDEPGDRHGEKPRSEDREFGARGWVLVGMLFLAFGVIPMTIFFIPRAQWLLTTIGLGYRDAFLVLPLLPALLLGAMAVWATTRP